MRRRKNIENEKNGYTVRRENIQAIFEAVAAVEQISRSDAAKVSGLSLMTVGKVADSMLEAGIITQSKANKNSAGRKAGLMELTDDYKILLLDLKTSTFRAILLNFRLVPVYTTIAETSSSNESAEKQFSEFIKKAAYELFRNDMLSKCVCAGAIFGVDAGFDFDSGSIRDYALPDLSDSAVRQIVSEQMGIPLITAVPSLIASAHYAYRKTVKVGRMLYVYLGEIFRGILIDSEKSIGTGRLDKILTGDGETLGNKYKLILSLKNARLADELLWELAIAIHNYAMLSGADSVCVDIDKEREKYNLKLSESLIELASKTEFMPKILWMHGEQGDYRFIAEKTRLGWVYKRML